jgi:two-component system sensor histidine kinase KdpD
VITTLTVQQIESLADPVRDIVGRVPDTNVPDEFLRRADQIELVDMTPEAIRRRVAHGNVFEPGQLGPADADLYNSDAFAQLRALMMFWMADRLAAAREDPRGAREKVVVAVTDSPTADAVLRRAARLALRSRAPLLGLHVRSPGVADDPAARDRRIARVEALGATYHELVGDDVAAAMASFAESERATQLVIGGSGRPAGVRGWLRRSITEEVARRAPAVDVHVVSTTDDTKSSATGDARLTVRASGPSRRRQLLAFGVGAAVLIALSVIFSANRTSVSVATALAVYLLTVVGITAIGGRWPGLTSAIASPLLANWFLIPPLHTFRINDRDDLIQLVVFLSVAAIVSGFVSIAAQRAAEAERARREAATLAELAGAGGADDLGAIVEQLRSTFHFEAVAVLGDDGTHPIVQSGVAIDPEHAQVREPLAPGITLAANGAALGADDHRVLRAFLAQLGTVVERQRLRRVAEEADALAKADELGTAILRAVSHDLRSPLAGIKASVTSLRETDIDWPDEVRAEFLESIESETDRLTAIVTNLLDLSRLEAGVLRPVLRSVSLEEVVPSALHGLGPRAAAVEVDLPDGLDEVTTDPALLERVIANLVANAVAWSPPGEHVRVLAHRCADGVQVHVIDHGPGIPASQRDTVVRPFHRLGDGTVHDGLGLGLAIADRFVAAMGGSLELRDTPRGGLTCVVTVPAAVTT